MARYLRISVRRRLGDEILASRPFGRREMFEGGGPKERGKGPRMGLNIRVSDRDFFDFRGQVADAKRFLRRYDAPLRRLVNTRSFRVEASTSASGTRSMVVAAKP